MVWLGLKFGKAMRLFVVYKALVRVFGSGDAIWRNLTGVWYWFGILYFTLFHLFNFYSYICHMYSLWAFVPGFWRQAWLDTLC